MALPNPLVLSTGRKAEMVRLIGPYDPAPVMETNADGEMVRVLQVVDQQILNGDNPLDLTYWARQAKVRMGTPDEQAAFDLANLFMKQASDANYFCKIKIPQGKHYYNPYQADRANTNGKLIGLQVWNLGGWYTEILNGVLLIETGRLISDDRYSRAVNVMDPVATAWAIQNLMFDGGWLFDGFSGPHVPWLDKQHCIVIDQDYFSDSAYRAKSPVRVQNPRYRVYGNMIANYGGNGIISKGSGANTWHGNEIMSCGGHGWWDDTFDSNVNDTDIGDTRRSGYFGRPNSSNKRLGNFKAWYPGFGMLDEAPLWDPYSPDCDGEMFTQVQFPYELQRKDNAGIYLDRSSGNQFSAVSIQDTWGPPIYDEGWLNRFEGQIGWGRVGNVPMEVDTPLIHLGGGYSNYYGLQAYVNPFSSVNPGEAGVSRLIKSTIGYGGTRWAKQNTIDLTHLGMKGDLGPLLPQWFEGGDNSNPSNNIYCLDDSNAVRIRESARTPKFWMASQRGTVEFTSKGTGGIVLGLIQRTELSTTPGDVILVGGNLNLQTSNPSQQFTTRLHLTDDGKIRLPAVPTFTSYASDGAAAVGGVGVGYAYRNGSLVSVRIA